MRISCCKDIKPRGRAECTDRHLLPGADASFGHRASSGFRSSSSRATQDGRDAWCHHQDADRLNQTIDQAVLGGMADGAAIGVTLGGGLGVALNVLRAISAVLTFGALGSPNYSPLLLSVPMVCGGLVGAAFGALASKAELARRGESVGRDQAGNIKLEHRQQAAGFR